MRFSIITPVLGYNEWLSLCVESVRDQVLVCDSIAAQHILLNALPADAERVNIACKNSEYNANPNYTLKIVHSKDGGMYDAINKGFSMATGDVLAWLNSDEQYLPDTLATVSRRIHERPKSDLYAGDTVLLDQLLRPIAYRKAVVPDYRFIQASSLNLQSCSMFIRRKWFDAGYALPLDYKTISDAAWMVTMMKAGLQIELIGHPTACFVMTGKNLGQSQVAQNEIKLWYARSGFNALQRMGIRGIHFAKEFFAGAKSRRSVAIDIFTPDSGPKRKRVVGKNLSPRFIASKSP